MKYSYIILKVSLTLVVLLCPFFYFNKVFALSNYEAFTTEDAWISSKFPNNNYGGATQLFVFYRASEDTKGKALFKFDLTPIPANSTIVTAYFYLYLLGDGQSCYGEPAGRFYISQINSSWSENAVTWNNQPSTYFNSLNDIECTTGWRSASINNIVQGIVSGEIENGGFMVHGLLYSQDFMRTIMSKESGQNFTARIGVSYELPEPTPTPTPAPSPSPTPDNPSGGTTTQVGISAGTGAAPSAKTSKDIKPPTDLLAKNAADEAREAIKLTWKISESTNIDGYKIFRSEQEADAFTDIALAEKGISEFIDESIESGKTYYYFLRSYKGDTESESTATVSAVSTMAELADEVKSQSNKSISNRDLYIILGAFLLFLLAFLLFYELNWKNKLRAK